MAPVPFGPPLQLAGRNVFRSGRLKHRLGLLLVLSRLAISASNGAAADHTPPTLVFNSISVQLDSSGRHTFETGEIAQIAAGSWDESGISNIAVTPSAFDFCDVGTQMVQLTLRDFFGNTTNRMGPICVLPPAVAPAIVYVDVTYPSDCTRVGFPNGSTNREHFVGLDAFRSIQSAVNQVRPEGVIYIAAGTYVENVILHKPVFLTGPNVGRAGASRNRLPEARVIPAISDPENGPIISIESDNVVIDGFLLDGSNPALAGGYNANGVRVHAAAGVQNGTYPDLADVEHVTVRNNIITNISYDGICLDRYQYFGTSSAWNYIRNNQLANMWEGILTYALDSVISGNVISNVTHGIGVHCVSTRAPKEFAPLIASNVLTIAQWWPVEIQAARAPGIWVNFRRDDASTIAVLGNVINTPVPAPPLKTIIGLYALTVDGNGEITFADNVVNGQGNCTVGFLAADCWSNDCVKLVRSSLRNIGSTGVQADTLDAKWGPGNCFMTVNNVDITLSRGAVGVMAVQQGATPANTCSALVTGNTRISGGACGVQVRGPKACATVIRNGLPICANDVGIQVDGGRALLEGNTLTNNRLAAIRVDHNGIVDAGDCAGLNITGLGTGSGPNGASAGLNDFSAYGRNREPPWAITNSGTVAVRADGNIFDAARPRDAIAGLVTFSGSGTLAVFPPPLLQLECVGEVPGPAKTMEEFAAMGGTVMGGEGLSIMSRDSIVTNRPGHYVVTRSYTLAGGCSQPVSCEQTITADDDQPPTLQCSPDIVSGTDPGCDYATVTFTNLAADSCGELLGPWTPVSTVRLAIGTNTIIVVATDLANNSTACSFDIAVVAGPMIIQQPASRTNDVGTTASFKVVASSPAPLSYGWKKNDVALGDGGKISGAKTAELSIANVVENDAGDYSVEVSNFVGTTASAKAHLTVMAWPINLRVVGVSGGTLTLEVTSSAGSRCAILSSTNLVRWAGLYTNTAPFTFSHINGVSGGCRFYRGLLLP